MAIALLAIFGLRALRTIEAKISERTLAHDGQASLLKLVFNTMTEGVLVVDPSGKVLYQNRRAGGILGTTADHIDLDSYSREHNYFVFDGVTEHPLGVEDLPISLALKGETLEHFVIRVGGPDKRDSVWHDVTALPLHNENGVIIGAVEVFSEATERIRADRERSMLAAIVEASADAIVSLTPDFRISSWNPAAERLFGYRAAEAIGQMRQMLVPASRAAELEEISARQARGEEVRGFGTIRRRKDGSEFPVLISIAPILSEQGRIVGYSDIITDLTALKGEEEMRTARDVAKEAAKLRSQFLANMSHEIRTPLNPVLGMAQLLLLTPLDSRQREYVETIWSSGDLLRRVVSDILDFSKLASGKMSLDKCDFDVVATVEAAIESMAERADAKHLELALAVAPDVPHTLRGDPNRLRQVLTNLISNAIKFTDHGEVIVTVENVESPTDQTVLGFKVNDTGVGIAAGALQQLFQPFVQADASTARKYGGSGLGLAICRELVERMEGTIGVESVVGKGSCFHFSASFETAQHNGHSFDAARFGLGGKRVLIVDDNASQRLILSNQLTAWQIQPTYVESGTEALSTLSEAATAGRGFHVALIDLNMPGMNGRALAHAIRSNLRFTATRLALMAPPAADSSDIQIPQEVDAVLFKPVKRVRLIETLCMLAAVDDPNCVHSHGMLPLSDQSEGNQADAARAPWPAKILLVEDDHVNQTLALNQLEYLGYKADAVDGGGAALQALGRSNYDLILMDCQMPMMDGYQTTASLRQREGQLKHTPTIAMTANAMDGDREKCLDAGMDDYIAKPVDLNLLAAKLRQWLSRVTRPSEHDADRGSAAANARVRIDAAVISEMRELSRKVGYDVLRKTAEVFFAEAPQRIADLRNTIGVHDLARAAEIAHQLKGAAGCVGITSVWELCARIETDSKKGLGNDTEKLLQDIEAEVSGARELLLSRAHPEG